jgi:exopolyphosphatase/guanosine-5'-triphosphate,3'-diphosphate pyrophosphatase
MELAERCNHSAEHSRQIARLAVSLFDQTRGVHGLGDREREWLEYAAIMHDLGVHISYEKHHRHSYYLVKNGDLRGFDPQEIEVMALVTRYHRQATPKKSHEGYVDLPGPLRRTVRTLAAILRLAEGLDRSHSQPLSGVELMDRGDDALVQLRTGGDAELELWAATRHVIPFERMLGKPVRFEIRGTTSHVEHTDETPRVPRPAVRGRGRGRVG